MLFLLLLLICFEWEEEEEEEEGGGGSFCADVAADEAGLVAVDAFQSYEFGGEMVAVDRFLAAVANRTRQIAEAAAAVTDRLLSNALRKKRGKNI